MSGRVTPAVRSMEKAGVAFQLLEYDYDPSADAIGLLWDIEQKLS